MDALIVKAKAAKLTLEHYACSYMAEDLQTAICEVEERQAKCDHSYDADTNIHFGVKRRKYTSPYCPDCGANLQGESGG